MALPDHNSSAEPVSKGILPTCKQALVIYSYWNKEWKSQITKEREALSGHHYEPLKNLISLLQLSPRNWLFFLIGFTAWTADAFDFHALSVQTVKFAAHYDKSKSDITSAITLTLLLCSVGAVLLSLAGD